MVRKHVIPDVLTRLMLRYPGAKMKTYFKWLYGVVYDTDSVRVSVMHNEKLGVITVSASDNDQSLMYRYTEALTFEEIQKGIEKVRSNEPLNIPFTPVFPRQAISMPAR